MCGVFGFIGRPTKKTNTALRHLADWNEIRGRDSTGLVISNGKQHNMFKTAQTATQFLKDSKTIALLNKYKNSDFINVIGHTRSATRGGVNRDNAHPFKIGRFLLAHNGVINNFDELQKECKTEYPVDSQIIGYLLNIFEPKEVFEKLLSGWFTVPYFDLKKQTELNIAKHTAPLSIAVLPDKSGVYYSSTKFHLQNSLKKAEIKTGVGVTLGSKLYKFKWVDGKIQIEKSVLRNKNSFTGNVTENITGNGTRNDPYRGYYATKADVEDLAEDLVGVPNITTKYGYGENYKYSYSPKKQVEEKVKKQLALVPIKDVIKRIHLQPPLITSLDEPLEEGTYDIALDGSLKRAYC